MGQIVIGRQILDFESARWYFFAAKSKKVSLQHIFGAHELKHKGGIPDSEPKRYWNLPAAH